LFENHKINAVSAETPEGLSLGGRPSAPHGSIGPVPQSCRFDYWILVPLSLLAVAVVARLVTGSADLFDHDTYSMMRGIEKSFAEYSEVTASFAFPLRVHYWFSYRIFGGSLAGYQALPVFSSILTVVVVYWGIRRYWHSAEGVCSFALLLLVYNPHSLLLASYAMFTYANSLFVSAFLYFLFLRLSRGELMPKKWILIAFAIIPMAFFSNLTVIVPVITGVFSVVVFRWLHASASRNIGQVWRTLKEMWPLAIFPLTYIVIYSLYPFTNIGPDKRPDMAHLFFYSSPYSKDFWGVLQFISYNTYSLFSGLLFGVERFPALGFIIFVMAITLMIPTFVRLVRDRVGPDALFTLTYIAVTFLTILAGGLAGYYPFGNERYADYMLIPLVVFLGYNMSLISLPALRAVGTLGRSKLLPVMLATIIVIFGGSANLYGYGLISRAKAQNYRVLEELENAEADLVFYSSYKSTVLEVKLKDLYDGAYDMGYGKLYGEEGGIPVKVVEAVKGDDKSKPVKSILVIAPREDMLSSTYPAWSKFIDSNFKPVGSLSAPSIWVGYFEKT
jgi:hypothetical protein